MKHYFLLFLLSALAWGCNDSEGDNHSGTGSETQQPVSPDEILPRRLVSVDVTPMGDSPYSETYAYDGQGRLTSITFGDGDTYTYTYTDNTIVAGIAGDSEEITYRLKNGRIVTARCEDVKDDWWSEMLFNYDAVGYLASFSSTGDEGFEFDGALAYALNGVLFKSRGNKWDATLSIEFDRARLNNLNLDFYGEFCWGLANVLGEYCQFYLFGVGGQRLRYLPAATTIIEHDEEEGQWKMVIRYVYHMDGDYLSEVEIYTDEGEGESKEPTRIVFHYE